MNLFQRCGFALVYTVPALLPLSAALGSWTGYVDLFAWLPLAVLFGLVPIADYALGRDSTNPTPAQAEQLEADAWFRGLTLLALPVHLLVLAWSAHHFAHAPFDSAGQLGWLIAQGVVGGVLAINTAHELIHKDSRLERAAGGALLASVGYHGFKVEHLRGHHVHVATPADASSARMGQSVWAFVPRALWRNTQRAWQLEAQRVARLGLPAWHPRNELVGWTALWLGLAAAFTVWLGAPGFVFFIAQGFFAAVSLEIINYIEHYGLERAQLPDGRYERTTHLHSWNSDYRLSNWLLFHLQRHSDHHASPRRRYPALRHHADSPQLPGGYGAMFVLALVPPLWFRAVHPVLARWRAGH
ncbi:alkane 1-monooxygenase [Cognatilysobacter bugurensis]|uniref:Alkane 1-monooxygenase 2 n=1 Tax=Cognatilysobacter bugurensis TaxID=543356 RepID=A0A918W6W8_9GAMM|nr:alkane 1-monooxygenase [Lysobacter bugurensis]GHA79600.1 alkane 1-monooxygenase 2 [Lysobacter bugurensis]